MMLNKKHLCVIIACFFCVVTGCDSGITPVTSTDSSVVETSESVNVLSSQEVVSTNQLPSHDEISSNSQGQSTMSEEEIMSEWRLLVNGKDITEGNHIEEAMEKDYYVEVPFIAIMEELGAKVEWSSKTTANITYNDVEYYLDTEDCIFSPVGDDDNLTIPPPGGRRQYETLDYELILDGLTMDFCLSRFGFDLSVDYERHLVRVDPLVESF